MTTPLPSRRDLLKHSAAGLIGLPWMNLGQASWLRAAEPLASDAAPIRKQLIIKTETPFNAEGPLLKLGEQWITPLESYFVRTNGPVPSIEVKDFTLTVDGLVEKPLTLKVGELLERFPSAKTTATLTCAGNRRIEFAATKKASGLQWVSGAVGNAEWQGVRLSDVLKLAGIQAGAKHVWFEGRDEVVEKNEKTPFGGSIPLEKAMADTPAAPGALLATRMNGRVLLPEHGFPLRAVVPGFIGSRSVKWLGRITLSDRPSPNHFVARSYKVITEDTPAALEAAAPINEQCLNSMICSPAEGAAISGDRLTMKGFAMAAGHAGRSVKLVEISTDNGQSWQPARFTSPLREFCWVLWSADVALTATTANLLVRATDSSGETQPQTMPWNAKGYLYNAWHKVSVKRA
jgi:sulfite oxidase